MLDCGGVLSGTGQQRSDSAEGGWIPGCDGKSGPVVSKRLAGPIALFASPTRLELPFERLRAGHHPAARRSGDALGPSGVGTARRGKVMADDYDHARRL
jgi:hypothetical protein